MKGFSVSFLTAVLVFVPLAVRAQSGATVPWTTYEAENMVTTGTVLGPQYGPNIVASESSGRKCVQLNATGQYVQFTNQAAANSLVVRYSVPDTVGGGGADYTLSLYTNNVFAGKLPLTSRYSWLYGSFPFTNSPASGSPRNFYDEVRTNGLALGAGVVVKLQKDAGDSATNYVIDFADVENVAAPAGQPGGSVSVKSAPYNAAGDGVTDDTLAMQNCLNANNNVWLPAGNYKITGSINIPAGRTLRGAGMWHTTLVGDASLYGSPAERITLNGAGSNIQLADFAIVGRLDYRNDSEANDGLGGTFGTNSSIARVWVEHTKAGAWLVNSRGLVVQDCRFRNTLADGIGLVVGMRSTTVTNCTARGTGDDCFAIWPADYFAQTYAPGLNVITRCTGQLAWLANGGTIYGGEANRIEDCLFQDMSYGCGILISTTFPVGANDFSGTTVAQRSFVERCGGFDPGRGWRAAVQLCLENKSLAGVNLNNLTITNSASDGVSIIAPGSSATTGVGTLSGALMANVTIPNYGLGTTGRHGLWASPESIGFLTVSNCTLAEYQDDSTNFAFIFITSAPTNSPPVQSLGFIQQPTDTLLGATLAPAVQVQAIGTNGQPVAGAWVTLSLAGTGILAGNLTRVSGSNGVAQFNDLTFSQPGLKTLTATAGAGGAPPTNSTAFFVVGPATGLAFTTQPGAATAGLPFGQQPVLKTVDAAGTPSTVRLPAYFPVTVSLTNGSGALTGTTNFNLGTAGSNGVVTFNNLAIATAGSGNRLVASGIPFGAPVSGMAVWLDGGVSASVLTNGSGVVTNWLDQSGNGHHFGTTIGSGGGGIRYTNTVTNGRRTVTFNATSASTATELKNTTYTRTNAGTLSVFVVSRKTFPGTAEGQYQRVLATWTGGANQDWQDAGSFSLDYNQSNNVPRIVRQFAAVNMEGPTIDPSTNFHVFEYVADGAGNNRFWLSTAGATTQSAGPTPGSISANFNIVATSVGGGLANGTTIVSPFAGSIAEVLIYNSALNSNDRQSVETYLRNKWLVPNGGQALNALSDPFTVLATNVSVTVQSSPAGLGVAVDGTNYTTPQVFNWPTASAHTLATTTPQSGGPGVQYVWNSWSDGGALSHSVTPQTNTTFTANFATQYLLTMNAGAGAGGSVSPAGGWQNAGTPVNISATASNGFVFVGWTGAGSGSYSGSNNAVAITMNAPITQTAAFTPATRIIALGGDLNFGNVSLGSSTARTLTISNTGNTTLTVSGLGYPAGFNGNWSGIIAASTATNVQVTFAPVAVTNYSGVVTVMSDATSGSNTLALAGTGVPNTTRTVLIDFGSANSFRGLSVANPDPNGKFWNSVTPNIAYTNLTASESNATTLGLTFTTPFSTDSYNGPAGVTSAATLTNDVLSTDINAAALGNLGVTNAVFDYMDSTNGRFEIQGLNPAMVYRLRFFGSHKYNTDNVTRYSVFSSGGYTSVVAAAELTVGVGANHNRDTVATLTNLVPQAGNAFYIRVAGTNGGAGYLNAMEIFGNTPPVASPLTFIAPLGQTLAVNVLGGVNAPTDPDGDTLTVSAVGAPTVGGGTVTTNGGSGFSYNATGTAILGTNQFTYTVADAFGANITRVVTVILYNPVGFNRLSAPSPVGGTVPVLNYLGVPGWSYALEYTTNLASPVVWTSVVTNVAATNGLTLFTNAFSAPLNFYRARAVNSF